MQTWQLKHCNPALSIVTSQILRNSGRCYMSSNIWGRKKKKIYCFENRNDKTKKLNAREKHDCNLLFKRVLESNYLTAVQVILYFHSFLQSWDPALAKSAKAWAKRCMFEHNMYLKIPQKMHPTFPSIGENIWTGTATIFSVHTALTDWFDEVKSYDFNTRRCSDMCGHYTQVSLMCPVVYYV